MPPPTPVIAKVYEKTCRDCRYAATHRQPRVIDATGFDDQIMFDDPEDEHGRSTDVTIYECKAFVDGGVDVSAPLCEHAGKTIGLVPITCSAWAAPKIDVDLARIDAMIAAREARMKSKDGK